MNITLPEPLRASLLAIALLLHSTAIHAADFTTYSGEELFKRLCAACHGPQARGDGPVAASLKVTVPDLRQLTLRHRGKFPAQELVKFIDGRTVVPAHGTRQMPVWGDELLRSEAGDPEAEAEERQLIEKMVEYLRSIQV